MTLLVILASVAVPGAQEGPANEKCPVMPDEYVDPEKCVDYQGRRVYLCCNKCIRKFKADPERYMKLLPPVGGKTRVVPNPSPNPPKGLRRALRFAGKLHPAAVHFPIALVLVALVAELLLLWRGNPAFANAGRFCVWVGAVTAAAAAGLGWAAGEFAKYGGDLASTFTWHRWLGTATGGWVLISALLAEAAARRRAGALRWIYRFSLVAGAALIGVTGLYGGTLIYGADHYSW